MIKNDTFTVFNNKEFIIYQDRFNCYKLLSHDPENLQELLLCGFIHQTGRSGLNILTKEISKNDVSEVYSIHTFGVYKKNEFRVVDKKDDQYLIYADDQKLAEDLDFEEFDRGGFRKWVDEIELDPIYERKTPLPNFFD